VGGLTPSSLVQVDLAALSHPGKVRPNNEDHYLVARFDRSMNALLTNLSAGRIPDRYGETAYGILVADGMGGEAGGEVASEMAITSLVDLVLQTPDWIMRLDTESAREVLKRMDQRIARVEGALVDKARFDPSLMGMGTTITVVCGIGADLLIGHVGDSRAYLFRHGRLHRLTRDHTVAQALADAGAIDPEAVDSHPMHHILTHVIGTKGGKAQAELGVLQLKDGDEILLCTDGLTDMVTDEAIAAALVRGKKSADVCESLIEMALEGGGRDNVTVALARYRFPQ
jgi:protein phosphatase